MNIVENIIAKMLELVKNNELELMEHYPNDLLVHDRAVLEALAVPGAKIAWMVGHSHTHMFPLGIHPEKNISVTWVTNLSNDDRFYLITVGQQDATFKELDRKGFEALQHTPIHYSKEGSYEEDFWLRYKSARIGHISAQSKWAGQQRHVTVSVTPVAGISPYTRSILEMWGDYAATKVAHSLFTPRSFDWKPEIVVLDNLKAA